MKRKVLIVEDNINLSQMQKDWFVQAGYDAITAVDATKARSLIRKVHFDLILSDVRLPDGDGISLLEWLRKEKNNTPFIITTEYVSVPDVVRTIKLGAVDYLPKPVRKEHLLELTKDVFAPLVTVRKQEPMLLQRKSARMREILKYAEMVAPTDMSVLIYGASGTGKESIAQSIHQGSDRSNMHFSGSELCTSPQRFGSFPTFLVMEKRFLYRGADNNKAGYFDKAQRGVPCSWMR